MPDIRIPLVLNLSYAIPTVALSVLRDNIILIAFSERVIGFTADDIEIVGGTFSGFRGNGTEYLVNVDTATTATLSIRAGVAASVYGELNTESNRLTYDA